MRNPELKIPESVLRLPRFPEKEIFRVVCEAVSDGALKSIANCDYGHEYSENLEVLVKIRNEENWGAPLEWGPREVLQLYRWAEYGKEYLPLSEHEFHLGRMFACGALRHIRDKSENSSPHSVDVSGPMLESCLIVGGSFLPLLRSDMLDELERTKPWEEHTLFWIFALLASCVLDSQFDDGPMTEDLGNWLVEVSDESLGWFEAVSPGAETFLDIRFETIHPEKWKRLASYILASDLHSEKTRDYLKKVVVSKAKNSNYRDFLKEMGWKYRLRFYASYTAKLLWRVIRGKSP
jgi:hypothetical protein